MSSIIGVTTAPLSGRGAWQRTQGLFTPPVGPSSGTIPRTRRACALSLRSLMGDDAVLIDNASGVVKYVGPSAVEALPSLFVSGPTRGWPRFEGLAGEFFEARPFSKLGESLHHAAILVQANDLVDPSGQNFQAFYVFGGELFEPDQLFKYRSADLRTLSRWAVSA